MHYEERESSSELANALHVSCLQGCERAAVNRSASNSELRSPKRTRRELRLLQFGTPWLGPTKEHFESGGQDDPLVERHSNLRRMECLHRAYRKT